MDEKKLKIRQQLHLLYQKKQLKDKLILFMGGLPLAYDVSGILREYGLRINGILDNNPEKWGQASYKEFTYQVYPPEKISRLRRGGFLLIIYSTKYWLEMKEQIEGLGYKRNKDFVILDAYDLRERMNKNHKAKKMIDGWRKKYGKDAVFILLNSVMGDCYLSMLCMKEYLAENKISNPVLLGTNVCEKIVHLFEGYRFIKVGKEERIALELYGTFVGEGHSCLKILSIWDFELHFNRCRLRFKEEFHFMETYTDFVFHLKRKRFDIPKFHCENLKTMFYAKGLQPGKTVVLSPYAYSIHQQPPAEFWKQLAGYLREKGYSVCVNINPECEVNPVPDAVAMFFSLKESVAVLEYAGTLIAMRSGFCDVTSSASCKKILLYPERKGAIDYENHRPDKDFGSITRMGLAKEAVELEFDYEPSTYQVKWEELLKEVKNYI